MEDVSSAPFGLTLLVDKPLEWTSFDVVNKLRYTTKRATGKKKIKVGHAGTLDPLATGLVIICVGAHTKTIDQLMGLSKQYTGTFLLGGTTPSYDLETEIDQKFPLPKMDADALQEYAQRFVGDITQMPPPFSAKKVAGKKAYELARKGKEVDLKPAHIHIDRFDLNAASFPEVGFILDCSKGTYVRSLVHDFGKMVGSGAHLTSLRRTRIGEFSIDAALTVERAGEVIEHAVSQHKQTPS